MSLSLGFNQGRHSEAVTESVNLLPPFEEWGSEFASKVTNIEAHGYEIKFQRTTGSHSNIIYNIPITPDMLGKTVTLSIDEIVADGPAHIEVNAGNGWVNTSVSGGSVSTTIGTSRQDIFIGVSIRNTAPMGTTAFFRNPQLQFNGRTRFQPKLPSNSVTKNGLSTIGTNGRVTSARAPLAGITSSHLEFECEFTTGAIVIGRTQFIMGIFTLQGSGIQITNDGALRFATAHTGDWNNEMLTAEILNANTRYHVKAIFNNGRREIYINNRLATTHQASQASLPSAGVVFTIANNTGNSQQFDGVIHKAILRRNHHPIISYDFTNQDVNSSTVIDTASGNHGTLEGGVSYVQQRAIMLPGNTNLIRGEASQNNELFNMGMQATPANIWENGRLRVQGFSASHHGRGQLVTNLVVGREYNISAQVLTNGEQGNLIVVSTQMNGGNLWQWTVLNGFQNRSFIATATEMWVRFLRHGSNLSGNPGWFWDISLVEHDKNQPRQSQLNAANLEYPYDFTRNSNGQWQGLNFGVNQPRVNRSIGGVADE